MHIFYYQLQKRNKGEQPMSIIEEDKYRCATCNRDNSKLWRLHAFYISDLLCLACVEAKTGRKWERETTDTIEWWVPAVPNGAGDDDAKINHDAYYGYGVVPDKGVKWWNSLSD
jgi:hypothetical protein